jgi:hypothetical protein
MPVTINGTTGITSDGAYTGDGVSFADATPANTLVTTTAGNVGMGVAAPAEKLHIKSNADGSVGVIQLGDTGSTGYYSQINQNNNDLKLIANGDQAWRVALGTNNGTGNITFSTAAFNSGNTERMRLNYYGSLLIGSTNSPNVNTKLYAYNSSGQDDNNGIIQAASGSNSASVIVKTPIGTAQFFQWSDYGVRIGSRAIAGSNVGDAFITAGNDLVAGRFTGGRIFQVGDVGPGSSGSAMTVHGGSGGDIVQFFQNRNGTTPYWYFNTGGGYGVFSDSRLKENVSELNSIDSVAFIENLKPVEFNWKPEFGDANQRISGFLAQDVLKAARTEGQRNILTHWQTYDESDPDCPKMGLSDHRLLPSIVGALQHALNTIQEQQSVITALTARVEALEGKTNV